MLRIAGRLLAPRLVVLDKDGTLITFHEIWRVWFLQIMREIERQLPLATDTLQGIAGVLGYAPETGSWDPTGPLTLASTRELGVLLAGQIYQHERKTWDESLAVVGHAELNARRIMLAGGHIKPVGDVRGFLQRLRASHVVVALATTDDREATEQALKDLDIESLFTTTICGDDGLPLKPAPDMALEICRRVCIAPEEAIMVGDTIADMTMAHGAGFACAVGVTSGALPAATLAPYADVLVPDIHAIEIIPCVAGGDL